MLTVCPFPSAKAWVNATKSAFCAEEFRGRGSAQTVLSSGTTAAPAYHSPCLMKLLPSQKRVKSGSVHGTSVKSGHKLWTLSTTSRQLWRGSCSAELGNIVARYRICCFWKRTQGWSSSRAWYWVMWAFVIHQSGGPRRSDSTACEATMNWSCLKVS